MCIKMYSMLRSSDIVHAASSRRTIKRDYLWTFGSIYPYRGWFPQLRKVRPPYPSSPSFPSHLPYVRPRRRSIGYSEECLGLHYGNIHEADLGDGDGRKDEQFLARQYYFPIWGTCWESFAGGHHFRAWKQNGSAANTGAWFIG